MLEKAMQNINMANIATELQLFLHTSMHGSYYLKLQ